MATAPLDASTMARRIAQSIRISRTARCRRRESWCVPPPTGSYAPAWVLHDKPAFIPLSELPIWGDEGRLEVSMDLKKVGRDWVRTDAQLDAAAVVAGLTAIRRALFLGLQLDHQRH